MLLVWKLLKKTWFCLYILGFINFLSGTANDLNRSCGSLVIFLSLPGSSTEKRKELEGDVETLREAEQHYMFPVWLKQIFLCSHACKRNDMILTVKLILYARVALVIKRGAKAVCVSSLYHFLEPELKLSALITGACSIWRSVQPYGG